MKFCVWTSWEYLGATVQVIPSYYRCLKEKNRCAALTTDSDVIITEVGGTVRDIESTIPRGSSSDEGGCGCGQCHNIHTTLLHISRQLQKMKPNQLNTVKELRGLGIQPTCYYFTEEPLAKELKTTSTVLWCGTRSRYRIVGCRTSLPNSIER